MQKKLIRGLLALVLVTTASGSGWAATASTSFQVSATVLDNCAVSASNLSFGNYNPGSGSPTNMGTSVSVTCTNGLGYSVALDGGGSHDVTARVMSDTNSNTLAYQLYTTSGYSTIFGDGNSGSATVSGTGDGTAQPVSVFGQIAAGQFVPAGSYNDTIAVTVTY